VRLRRAQSVRVRDERAPAATLAWRRGTLCVEDAIPGGAAHDVAVDVARDGDRIFLRTVARLAKHEFETLFDFERGGFCIGKCISVSVHDVHASTLCDDEHV